VTRQQVHGVCLHVALLLLFADCLRPPVSSLSEIDRVITQVNLIPRIWFICLQTLTCHQNEWLQVAGDLNIPLPRNELQSAFQKLDTTGIHHIHQNAFAQCRRDALTFSQAAAWF